VLVLAVGCAIEMGLPVCISAKANFHVDFAGIAVTHTRHCVLRRLLLLKHQQMRALESESHLFLLHHLWSTMRVWKKSQIWKISVHYHPAHPWWLKLLMSVPQKWLKGLQIIGIGLSKLLDNIKKKLFKARMPPPPPPTLCPSANSDIPLDPCTSLWAAFYVLMQLWQACSMRKD